MFMFDCEGGIHVVVATPGEVLRLFCCVFEGVRCEDIMKHVGKSVSSSVFFVLNVV